MADKIKQISEFGNTPLWALAAIDSTTDPLSIGKGVRSESILLSTSFDEAGAGIKNSVQLTARGKKDGLEELGKPALENIKKLRHRLAPVEKARGEAIGKARAATKSTEEKIADLLMQGEIRRLLSEQIGGDPIQLKIVYHDAIAAGDFATATAIEEAPMLWPGRPDAETLEKWKAARLAVEIPELSEEVKDLTDCLGDCGAILDSVEKTIRDVSGLRANDGIEAIADGVEAD